MVKMEHHETLGGFFINHPPIKRFTVDVKNVNLANPRRPA